MLHSKGDPSSPEAGNTDRRGVLALIGAGGAAAMAALLGRTSGARAASGEALIIGEPNEAGDHSTQLAADVEGPAFDVVNRTTGGGLGIVAHTSGSKPAIEGANCAGGDGVFGVSSTPDPDGVGKGEGVGVAGFSGSGIGVQGSSQSGPGVFGGSQSGPGVMGSSKAEGGGGTGVEGFSDSGDGVAGHSDSGRGVFGHSDHGTGVVARVDDRDSGLALEVEGKARFFTCGAYTLPRGDNSVFVDNPAVTDVSHITVTLTGNPGLRELRWVERMPGSGFRVHLTPDRPKPATGFTYLIVEPGA